MGPYGPQPGPGPNPDWALLSLRQPWQTPNPHANIKLQNRYRRDTRSMSVMNEFLDIEHLIPAPHIGPGWGPYGPIGPLWAHKGPYGPIRVLMGPMLLKKILILMKNHKIINKNIKIVNLEILKVETWFWNKDLSSLDSIN